MWVNPLVSFWLLFLSSCGASLQGRRNPSIHHEPYHNIYIIYLCFALALSSSSSSPLRLRLCPLRWEGGDFGERKELHMFAPIGSWCDIISTRNKRDERRRRVTTADDEARKTKTKTGRHSGGSDVGGSEREEPTSDQRTNETNERISLFPPTTTPRPRCCRRFTRSTHARTAHAPGTITVCIQKQPWVVHPKGTSLFFL